MINQGWAIARYDSRDGYGRHAREASYVAADAASPAKGWARTVPPIRWAVGGDALLRQRAPPLTVRSPATGPHLLTATGGVRVTVELIACD